MRVLVYSSERQAAETTSDHIRDGRFNPEPATDYADAVDRAKVYGYDLIVAGSDAVAFAKSLRLASVETPIVAVTDDRTEALAAGADYALSSPVDGEEFTAALNAVVRRSHGHATNVIECGPVVINLDTMDTTVNGKSIKLTRSEYRILQLLILRQGSVVGREAVMNHLYGGRDEPDVKSVDVFVSRIRSKLRQNGLERFIMSCWGTGYMVAA